MSTLPALALVLALAAGADAARVPDGFEVREVETPDGPRRALVHLPPTAAPGAVVPLVLGFHGGGGTPEGMERLTRLAELGDRAGFAVAYPEGVGRAWNDGRPEKNRDVDDVGFVGRLLDDLLADLPLDPARVYATGISNGGFLCFRLAGELADRIAAIAPVAALTGEVWAATARPATPVPMILVLGVEDPLVPIHGGNVVPRGFKDRGRVLSLEATVAFWAPVNRVGNRPVASTLPDLDPSDGTRTRVEAWPPGPDGKPIRVLLVEGGGHTWPGGWQYLSRRIIGRTARDFSASEVIWEFVSSFSLSDGSTGSPEASPEAAPPVVP